MLTEGEAEYTMIPPSPMFSRATSQQAIEEERVERLEADRVNQKPIMRKQKSNGAYNYGGARYSDKHSVVSGKYFSFYLFCLELIFPLVKQQQKTP
ncbi:unnamed protein product [Rodentolepis nana]|uniref:Uncharacterized protein n=1 Tax=Rodentolepis nana TaxID=102285 RepID=A0A0R3TVI2_RODNA|nr:unnamed protein product [Rodentolepis nana]